MDARMLIAGYFYNLEVGLAYSQVKLCFNLKTGTVYLEVIEAVLPEGIEAAEHVSEANPEKPISD